MEISDFEIFTRWRKGNSCKGVGYGGGTYYLLTADKWERAWTILGRIWLECRDLAIAKGKMVIPADQFTLLWGIDFPLVTFHKEQGRFVAIHHPFTASVPTMSNY
jgi:aspartyl-tRNA synthetase